MAKDPGYDRYAGITSLPGDPLNPRQPRPFRVDEDGNVKYLDEEPGAAKLADEEQSRRLAKAGLLDWDAVDRRVASRLARLTADGSEPLVATPSLKGRHAAKGSPVVTRIKIGGIDYDVLSATTYVPALSNGVTSKPDEDMISIWNSNRYQVAAKDGGLEKGAYTIGLPLDFSTPEGSGIARENPKSVMYYSLPVINPKTRSTPKADTFRFPKPNLWPVGTVALSHGHIDGTSEGMADFYDPSGKKPIYGDVQSLLGDKPVPTATVSEGDVGWHQLENGRLQFVYPMRTWSDKKLRERAETRAKIIQENLDRQQLLFQRRGR